MVKKTQAKNIFRQNTENLDQSRRDFISNTGKIAAVSALGTGTFMSGKEAYAENDVTKNMWESRRKTANYTNTTGYSDEEVLSWPERGATGI